jgi:hypothetical protein
VLKLPISDLLVYVMIILQYVTLCYSVVDSNSIACGRETPRVHIYKRYVKIRVTSAQEGITELMKICEISSSHGGEYEAQNVLN